MACDPGMRKLVFSVSMPEKFLSQLLMTNDLESAKAKYVTRLLTETLAEILPSIKTTHDLARKLGVLPE